MCERMCMCLHTCERVCICVRGCAYVCICVRGCVRRAAYRRVNEMPNVERTQILSLCAWVFVCVCMLCIHEMCARACARVSVYI